MDAIISLTAGDASSNATAFSLVETLKWKRSPGIGFLVSILAHAVLVGALLWNEPVRFDTAGLTNRIEVQLIKSPPRQSAQSGHTVSKQIAARSKVRETVSRAMPPVTPGQAALPTEVDEPIETLAEARQAPPGVVTHDLVAHAKRNIANILHEIDKQQPRDEKTLTSDRQIRVDRLFAEAHAAAPPGWGRPARIEEIPGTKAGARVYRITTAIGSYCVTYAGNGGLPTYGSCPK